MTADRACTVARFAGALAVAFVNVAWWRHKLALPRPVRIERVGDQRVLW